MKTPVTDVDHLAMIIVLMDEYMANWAKYEVNDVDENLILQFGFVKTLELIGEETLALTDEFKGKYSVNWTQLESYKDAFHWRCLPLANKRRRITRHQLESVLLHHVE